MEVPPKLGMTTMAYPVKRMCDELGVCSEEAICYLDGFQWNLDTAMEACRSKTLPLPSLTVESSPVNEKSAFKASSKPPIMIDSRRSLNPPDEQTRNQRIKLFCETAVGANLQEASAYLARRNWDVDIAVGHFMDERRPTPPLKKSNPQGKPLRLVSKSQFQYYLKPLKIGSSSSDSMEVNSTGEHIPEAIPLMASSQVKIQNIQESRSVWPLMDTWVDRVCYETKVSREEALYYLEGFKWNLGPAMEACRRKTFPGVSVSEESAEAPSNSPEQPSQLNNELISSFCDAVGGATREEAISFLKFCNWNVDHAVGFYIHGFSEDELSAAMAMSMTENRNLPLSSMGLPSQSQIQASLGYLKEGEIGGTSSLMEVYLTESERSLEEAGEENASVAIPGMASSQVDLLRVRLLRKIQARRHSLDRIILRPRAARTTITITIVLADVESVNIPFRSNQTVRDIRDAIDELTPDNDRDYFLQSMAGVDYMDSNITVHEISTGRSTTLLQIYSDP